jgi:hypothetical protein
LKGRIALDGFLQPADHFAIQRLIIARCCAAKPPMKPRRETQNQLDGVVAFAGHILSPPAWKDLAQIA